MPGFAVILTVTTGEEIRRYIRLMTEECHSETAETCCFSEGEDTEQVRRAEAGVSLRALPRKHFPGAV